MNKRSVFTFAFVGTTIAAGQNYFSDHDSSTSNLTPLNQSVRFSASHSSPPSPNSPETSQQVRITAPQDNKPTLIKKSAADILTRAQHDASLMRAMIAVGDLITLNRIDPNGANCTTELHELPSTGPDGTLSTYNPQTGLLSFKDTRGNIETKPSLIWHQSTSCQNPPSESLQEAIFAGYPTLDFAYKESQQQGFGDPKVQLTVGVTNSSTGSALTFDCQFYSNGLYQCINPQTATPFPFPPNTDQGSSDGQLPTLTSGPSP